MAINAEQVVGALESAPAWAVLGLSVRSERLRHYARDGLARFLVERLNAQPPVDPGQLTLPLWNGRSRTRARRA